MAQSPLEALKSDLVQNIGYCLREYELAQTGRKFTTVSLMDDVTTIAEIETIRMVLRRTHGNQLKSAAILGLNRNTLRKKLNQYNININLYRISSQ